MDLLKAARENPVREREGGIGWWGQDSGKHSGDEIVGRIG